MMGWGSCFKYLSLFISSACILAGALVGANFNNVQQSCNTFGTYVIGLRPDTGSFNCSKFFHCRPAKPNKNEPWKLQVNAYQFYCPEEDKPYFNHNTCECVSTDDHCVDENLMTDKCARTYDPDDDREETCSSFGPKPQYYLEIFPHLDNSSEFWICRPTDHPVIKAKAEKMVCPGQTKFDLRTCRCEEDGGKVSREFNTNPMNRFRCAVPIDRTDRNSSSDESPLSSKIHMQESMKLGHL